MISSHTVYPQTVFFLYFNYKIVQLMSDNKKCMFISLKDHGFDQPFGSLKINAQSERLRTKMNISEH